MQEDKPVQLSRACNASLSHVGLSWKAWGGDRQAGICVLKADLPMVAWRLGHWAGSDCRDPLRRGQASTGPRLWVSADLFGERMGRTG